MFGIIFEFGPFGTSFPTFFHFLTSNKKRFKSLQVFSSHDLERCLAPRMFVVFCKQISRDVSFRNTFGFGESNSTWFADLVDFCSLKDESFDIFNENQIPRRKLGYPLKHVGWKTIRLPFERAPSEREHVNFPGVQRVSSPRKATFSSIHVNSVEIPAMLSDTFHVGMWWIIDSPKGWVKKLWNVRVNVHPVGKNFFLADSRAGDCLGKHKVHEFLP